MQNIIQLRESLKSLSDEDLQREAGQPSGSAPEYLILAEVNRRGEMRKSYEAEARRRGEGRTTVAEDVIAGPTPMMPPAGIAQNGQQAGLPKFASGGLIDQSGGGGLGAAPGYGQYRQKIEEMMARSGAMQDQNRAMALLQAGLGIAGGTSPNFATNVAQGGLGALKGYRDGASQAEQRELSLMKMGADLTSMEQAAADRKADMDMRERLGMLKASTSRTKTPESERRIAALMSRGMTRVQAEDLTYGHVSTTTGETGDPVIVNRVTGEATPLTHGGEPPIIQNGLPTPMHAGPDGATPAILPPSAAPTAPVKGKVERKKAPTLWEDSELVSGVRSTGAELMASTPGLSSFTGRETINIVKARQHYRDAIGRFTKALATNPRFSDGERNQLRQELKILPSLLDQPNALRARMIAIDEDLRRRADAAEATGLDRSLAKKDRMAARAKARDIRELLDIMGVPAQADPMKAPSGRPLPPLPEGTTTDDILKELQRRGAAK